MRQRSNQTTLLVNGVMVEAVTVAGLAKILGKVKTTIIHYEKVDIFPLAPILKGKVRYYPLSLARRLVPIVNRFPSNRKIPAELIFEVNKVFKEETEKLCQQK